jgi:hypothetical protein
MLGDYRYVKGAIRSYYEKRSLLENQILIFYTQKKCVNSFFKMRNA